MPLLFFCCIMRLVVPLCRLATFRLRELWALLTTARLEEADFVFADAMDAVVTGTFLATLTFWTGI